MMLELPEASVLTKQLRETVLGSKIVAVKMNSSPHKFAFYSGEPEGYISYLGGKSIDGAQSYGGMVELKVLDYRLVFSDGVNLRFHDKSTLRPMKHQILIEFEDGSALSGSVQMYGGLWCFVEGEFENQYRHVALTKPSPLSTEFDANYFSGMIEAGNFQKLSLKAFLATEQRIPGLGNGVLHDILWADKLHPRRIVSSLSEHEKGSLFLSIKARLEMMVNQGGRDTEKDLYGQSGGYLTRMSNLHAAEGCAVCGGKITKEPYLGGSVYYCPSCQKL
jgi:formamidopyrimidine-DNA glycosylase